MQTPNVQVDPLTIVFVHGMYMNGESWLPWVNRAASSGFICHASSWPFHDGVPATRRATVDPGLGHLRLADIVDHYKTAIDKLPSRPCLIGHSIGGLVVQRLVNDGYAAAAVAVSPAPPRGIISLSPHFLPANFPHINPFAGNRPVIMTKKRFHYTFANTLTRRESDDLFEHTVPESRNVPRSALTKAGAVDFRRSHVPMLFLSGDGDHLTPIDAVRRNAKAYKHGNGVSLEVFAGRCHAICNAPGWEEVADRAFEFLRTSTETDK
jgi:pimeloyl-ACP methyl ester carboxylesterase